VKTTIHTGYDLMNTQFRN